MCSTTSGRFQQLKNKGKDQLVILKSGRGRLRELLVTEFEWQFKRGFTMLVETTVNCNVLEFEKVVYTFININN